MFEIFLSGAYILNYILEMLLSETFQKTDRVKSLVVLFFVLLDHTTTDSIQLMRCNLLIVIIGCNQY